MALETASQATSQYSSLNSIDEEDGDEENDLDNSSLSVSHPSARTLESPPKKQPPGSNSSSRELQAELDQVKADLEWSQETVKDLEAALDAKEKKYNKALDESKKLKQKMDGSLKVQEELMRENERAEKQYQSLLEQVEANKKAKSSAPDPRVASLQSEVPRLQPS